MRRSWIKLYVGQTLRGSCFSEMLPDERFVWFGFLLLGGDNPIEGKISVTESMGYSFEQLADLLKCNTELIKRSVKKMVKFDKIKMDGSNIIEIINWQKYQSEYQRQRNYREEYKKKLQRKVTPESYTGKCGIDIDIERDIDIEKEKENKEYVLSLILYKYILRNNPEYKKPNLYDWAVHIDYMIRLDKRKPQKIYEIIKWCQQDNFWHKNILSTEKLRKQYDKLVINMVKVKKPDWRTT